MRLRRLAIVAIIVAAGAGVTASAGMRPATASRATCAGAVDKELVHTAAANREATLDGLTAVMHAARDRYGLNGAQLQSLASARTVVVATDARVQGTCDATLAAFRADAAPIFSGERVYWLRVPQTKEIEAADRLSVASAALATTAAQLGRYVRAGTPAAGALAAMRVQLGVVTELIGAAPTASAELAGVAALQPALNMTASDAALRGERVALERAYAALLMAKADGLEALKDLRA
jgi:hypothetical protein